MRTSWDHTECQNLKNALSKEWLETNGLGGYASSTIIGANTRRHHGLLVAALQPPGARHVLLSKLEDRVLVDGHESHLSTNLYSGTVFPHGFNIQNEFRLRPWPTFRYASTGFEIEKSLCLIHGENTLVAAYHNRNTTGTVTLAVRPLLAFRDFNKLAKRNDAARFAVERQGHIFSVQPYPALPRLYFRLAPAPSRADAKSDWYFRFTYPVDQARGFEFQEDLFSPVEFTFPIPAGQTVHLIATTETHDDTPAAEALLESERVRRQQYADRDPARSAMLASTDAFIAQRDGVGPTIITGFPWFADSGRGAMVAFPGVLLSTKRFDMARRVLATFARYCDRGLLPNSFSDDGKPSYNAADAPLWFIVAAWKLWKASRADDSIADLIPTLRDIVKHYQAGTRFDIYADDDALINAGKPGTQLTWMDVKLDAYIPTPRHGKPVEVNALWLNALLMLAEIEETIALDVTAAVTLRRYADRVAASFVKTFWCADGGYLYDVVQGNSRDASVRPNQIFAVSLPFTPLSSEQQASVLKIVTEQLLTPYGLRTLSPRHEKYARRYTGTRQQRDAARHQGAAWPYLIGAYADAFLRVRGDDKPQRKELLQLLQPLLKHLEDDGLGHISELFDGDAPQHPSGCFARACSVSELLRAYDLCRA